MSILFWTRAFYVSLSVHHFCRVERWKPHLVVQLKMLLCRTVSNLFGGSIRLITWFSIYLYVLPSISPDFTSIISFSIWRMLYFLFFFSFLVAWISVKMASSKRSCYSISETSSRLISTACILFVVFFFRVTGGPDLTDLP